MFYIVINKINIVSVLLNIILKHNLKKLLDFVQCQGYVNYYKVVKGVRKIFELYLALWLGYQNFLKDLVGVKKFFTRCFRGLKAFLTPQKYFPP